MEKELLFGICADVHQEVGKDESWRMRAFVDEAKRRNAAFIIQLGDFVSPDEAGEKMLAEWNKFAGPKYHVLGNHDCECKGGKEAVMRFQGQKDKYYSFDMGNYHFVVLDTNYHRIGEQFYDYGADVKNNDIFNCFIDDAQLEWLKNDLDATDKRCFLFTHATLAVGGWTIYNIHRFRDVIWLANQKAGYNKVTMCFSGHDHADEYLFQGGVHYVLINSMTQKYIGPKYTNFSSKREEVEKDYGKLTRCIPYLDPLYAFVRLKPNGLVQIIGKQSEYVGNSPMEIHWEHSAAPQISYREVWMNGIGEL